MAEQVGVDVYQDRENKNPVEIAQAAIKHAKSNGHNVVIVDTAGRLAVDELKTLADPMLEEWSKTRRPPKHAQWLHQHK